MGPPGADEEERCSGRVARDAVFASNANNLVANHLAERLSKKTLKALWLAKALTWGELTGSSNKDAIKVLTRQEPCGAAEIWAKYLGASQGDLQGMPVKGDEGVANGVRKDPLALGYNNLQATFDLAKGTLADGLLVIPLDANDGGKIDPEADLQRQRPSRPSPQAPIRPPARL
jgi:phosphate transport system substrate-binding protein